jgi:hypothetical protein
MIKCVLLIKCSGCICISEIRNKLIWSIINETVLHLYFHNSCNTARQCAVRVVWADLGPRLTFDRDLSESPTLPPGFRLRHAPVDQWREFSHPTWPRAYAPNPLLSSPAPTPRTPRCKPKFEPFGWWLIWLMRSSVEGADIAWTKGGTCEWRHIYRVH